MNAPKDERRSLYFGIAPPDGTRTLGGTHDSPRTLRAKKKADPPRDRPLLFCDELNLEFEASANAEAAWFQGKDVGIQTR